MKRILLYIAVSVALALTAASVSAAERLSITKYNIDYTLGRDADGRSTLKTVETITADFPAADMNHGLERAIPQSYDGHSTGLHIESVKKTDGSDWNYSTSTSNDNLVLRIGDADAYLHGPQTFVISYTQRDVTRYFADTASDEFYWDTNGVDWSLPIASLHVSLTVDPSLAQQMSGRTACYRGGQGENGSCTLRSDGKGSYSVTESSLTAGENVTIALGFTPKTFAAYEKGLWQKAFDVWIVSLFVLGAVSVVVVGWIAVRYRTWNNRTHELGTVAPEYLPPKDVSVSVAANIIGRRWAAFAAQLLDLAVRHYIKIYQVKEKTRFSQPEFEIEITRDISSLRPEEREVVKDIFPSTAVGTRLNLKQLKTSTSAARRLQDNTGKVNRLVDKTYQIRHVDHSRRAAINKLGIGLLLLALVTLNPFLLVASIVAFGVAFGVRPLTDKGLELYRYLEGLKMYIGVAEKERLAMLQSPEGAARAAGVDASDARQLIKLYEQVLPYAVLFGQEKQWNKHIGQLYETTSTQPGWYSGNAAFSAAGLSSALSSFSSAATYSSATSSSSGGSGGGGSSGGGGGGGGGGGW